MRVLYGVQATGNGHISRARALGPALIERGCEVTFLFSGRERSALFDMEPFGQFLWRRGLTFVSRHGKVDPVATIRSAHPLELIRDIRRLRKELHEFDRIVTDYEPVTAWAARAEHIPAIGIGHQYAFREAIPKVPIGPIDRAIMNMFAPAAIPIGLHWHHFGLPILPPIAPLDAEPDRSLREPDRILVYLPFEDPQAIDRLLAPFGDHHFVIFHPGAETRVVQNRTWQPTSRTGFHEALVRCSGVICNAGFELVSEVLQIGLKILVKPMRGQPEQQSNALALRQLGLGSTMQTLDATAIERWLADGGAARVEYPDVAGALANWIAGDMTGGVPQLAQHLWQRTHFGNALPSGIPTSMQSSLP